MTGQLTLLLHPADDLVVALFDLPASSRLPVKEGEVVEVLQAVPAKHKFTRRDIAQGESVKMYGVIVGEAAEALPAGSLIHTGNLVHAVDDLSAETSEKYHWKPSKIPEELPLSFQGFYRQDGSVGAANYWLVVPLVFCENRNIELLRQELETQLGYRPKEQARFSLNQLVEAQKAGRSVAEMETIELPDLAQQDQPVNRVFPQVEALRFLTHEAGCGGTRGDSDLLIKLLAGYLNNPNVAGATILSLGCQNAQVHQLLSALEKLNVPATLDKKEPGVRTGRYNGKPIVVAEQQQSEGVDQILRDTIRHTFLGLSVANEVARSTAGVDKLCLGLECGGSDGFSGITANPLLGQVSDWLVKAGGRSILAEFPELNGVEKELIHRCQLPEDGLRFRKMMAAYASAAISVGSGFADNPSPGNIREGLITDAMKSAGAARKGGIAPISAVLDYGEPAVKPGLQLLCTPGNDVESTTALAGSGAQLIAFTTGLGTPTGNPVALTLKVSSNTPMSIRHKDIIDFDAGRIISKGESPSGLAVDFWKMLIATAGGEYQPKAIGLGQHDFIPWRRDISL